MRFSSVFYDFIIFQINALFMKMIPFKFKNSKNLEKLYQEQIAIIFFVIQIRKNLKK